MKINFGKLASVVAQALVTAPAAIAAVKSVVDVAKKSRAGG